MTEPVYDLDKQRTIEDTTRADYDDDILDRDDIFSEILSAEVQTSTTSAPVVDNTDYFTDKPHILFETKPLLKILSQLAPVMVIGQRSQRAVSRGITLRVKSTSTSEVISPNELYYFNALLETVTTFEEGQHIFLDYTFLQKIAKFLPPKVLIFKDTNTNGIDIYYIRLLTGDLELVSTQLIPADEQRLTYEYDITDTVQELEPSVLRTTLDIMSRVVNFESDGNRRVLSIKDGLATFKSPLVQAGSNTDLTDLVLRANDINYIVKAIGTLEQDEKLVIKNTNSTNLPRYAICTDNSYMITNFATPQEDVRLKEWLDNPPIYTEIDYNSLKYKLDYANAITYSRGVIEFEVLNNTLTGGIILNNGNQSDVTIEALDRLTIPEGSKFKVNTKTFLACMNALNSSGSVYVGFRDGLLYVKNDFITIILITI